MPDSTRDTPDDTRSAFESAALPCMKTLYNRAFALTRRPEVAAELVQETYLRAFRTFGNFEPGSNAKAWLLTILYSVFVTQYRKEKREPEIVDLEQAESISMEVRGEPSLLEPQLWASEEVNAALQRLPDTFRTLILMVEVDELSYEEAAAVMHCPVGTVRSRLSRARRVLHTDLMEYARRQGFGERRE